MEMSYEEMKQMKRQLRKKLSVAGWVLLVYYLIMNVAVSLWMVAEMFGAILSSLARGDFAGIGDAALAAADSGWGYFLAAAVGFVILLLWKKPSYWKNEIWAKGKPMNVGSFFALLAIFLGGQLVYQVVMIVVELILNAFGLSVLLGMEAVSMDTNSFSMFLYGGILAPITEEILFRGLIQRSLMPYGKRFAILCSAFTFGIFHGNLLQAPYAFLVGLVLGYVASEYSIAWAMLLHMINNLVLGDMLTRLTSFLPETAAALIFWMILLVSGIGGLAVMLQRSREIRTYRQNDPINRTCVKCFFSSAGTIVLMVVMGLNMIFSIFMMVTPL